MSETAANGKMTDQVICGSVTRVRQRHIRHHEARHSEAEEDGDCAEEPNRRRDVRNKKRCSQTAVDHLESSTAVPK
jgi:hypothetical protein